MQIQCEYCKNWIEDTVEKCPYCGASNTHLKRYADTTPKTIAELKTWYAERNLPPEEVTRFFIGTDYRAPKAFGIYQDGKNFIVYKNKADGSRAVRYKGPDEAYAVNELYLKLKEEILHQKARNMAKRSGASQPQRSSGNVNPGGSSRSYQPSQASQMSPEEKARRKAEKQAEAQAYARKKAEQKKKSRRNLIIFRSILFTVLGGLLALMATCTVRWALRTNRGEYYAASADPVYYRYTHDNSDDWEWWKYTDGAWGYFGELQGDENFPDGIDKSDRYTKLERLEKALNITVEPVRKSRAFLDMYPEKPKNAYYYAQDHLWYYAVDSYGAGYGRDRNGWYYYDEDESNWHYLARYTDSDQVPEELYYESEDYALTDDYKKLQSDYAYVFPAGFVWTESTDFKTSDYYEDIQWSAEKHAEEERERRQEERDNDNDNDYDWDDDDDWDYDDYDWDSDW